MAERIRIQKALSNAGLMSRRAAEMAISADRIRVNGRPVNLGDRVDVETDLLTVDDVPVPVNPDLETHLLYKPLGVVSTAHDTHGRPTVVDLVGSDTRLYPVGRLDADSEGLILVSNDGELTNRVTHPRYGITKRYVALVDGVPSDKQIRLLSMGIELDDGVAVARSARLLVVAEGRGMVELVMTEGRNREVRRMMKAIGFTVTSLIRTAIGPISDRTLGPGQSRILTPDEIQQLLGSAAS